MRLSTGIANEERWYKKFEFRNPKLETNAKSKCPMTKTKASSRGFLFGIFEFGSFELVSDFVLRISDFPLPASSREVEVENPNSYKLVAKKEV
jgi:hypothetical protein